MSEVLRLSPDQGRGPEGAIRPQLEPLAAVLGSLGDPQLAYPSILIAGTNGKGSTATMLAAVLRQQGLRVGLMTSPHLLRVEECICVDGEPISTVRLALHQARIRGIADLSPFELQVAAGFLELADRRVDAAVIETGLGAPWDATVLARPRLAGLTNVGTDHRRWLGETQAEIARSKGATVAMAEHVVLGPGVDPEVRPLLGLPAAWTATQLIRFECSGGRAPWCDPRSSGHTGSGPALHASWRNGAAGKVGIVPPLPGAHQIENLHLALALVVAAADIGIAPEPTAAAITAGLQRTRILGRLSAHRIQGREVILDGAHNLEGARALAEHLRTWTEPPSLLVSCLDDKPIEAMAKVLSSCCTRSVAVCSLDDPRAAALGRLQAAFPSAAAFAHPVDALASLEGPVVAAGSLRLVAALLARADSSDPVVPPAACPAPRAAAGGQ